MTTRKNSAKWAQSLNSVRIQLLHIGLDEVARALLKLRKILQQTMTKLPQRSKRFGVGKEIGGANYLHRQYEEKLGAPLSAAREHLPPDFDYHIVKLNERTGTVSFIQCTDFDTAAEPTVGDIVIVDKQGNVRRRKQPADPEIYHHKWLFVEDDYDGFDVEASKQRSRAWLALDGVDRSRIGRKSYWMKSVITRLRDDDDS